VKVGQDTIDAAVKSVAGLDAFAARMSNLAIQAPLPEVLTKFREVMDNDLDTPAATALIFGIVRQANTALDDGDIARAAALAAAVVDMCSAVGLMLRTVVDVDATIVQRAADLDAARVAKDFVTADVIRNELQSAGYLVETTKEGTRVRRG
jgi:cysteinyl-tRNA synthetase